MSQKKLNIEIENFIFYRSTKIVLICGKLGKPLISEDRIFLEKGASCRVKAKAEILNFELLPKIASFDFEVEPSYEEKPNRGENIKQFSATKVIGYNENSDRKALPF